MVWTCDANERREDTQEKTITHKNGGKRPRGRTQTKRIDQIKMDIKMRRENCEENIENRKRENRDSWIFLCNS